MTEGNEIEILTEEDIGAVDDFIEQPPQETKYYVDAAGNFLGIYVGAAPPDGAIEVDTCPDDGRQKYVNGAWQELRIVPDSVSARQFKLQLLEPILPDHPDGIEALVAAFIAASARRIQVAYENSGAFERNSPMMQAGFSALGFTTEQIDDFFIAANMQ